MTLRLGLVHLPSRACADAAVGESATTAAAMLKISFFMPRSLARQCGDNGSLELLSDERFSSIQQQFGPAREGPFSENRGSSG